MPVSIIRQDPRTKHKSDKAQPPHIISSDSPQDPFYRQLRHSAVQHCRQRLISRTSVLEKGLGLYRASMCDLVIFVSTYLQNLLNILFISIETVLHISINR
jgi:hypothetical protein